ncbi:MAG: hypothetical protein DRP12_01200 [Candidatus Aenigmatarchaeota archaeon]|nr:MAG: hypothetical protein DRP12_01200 [Candidatus Aenigmarchaeota archaeon]
MSLFLIPLMALIADIVVGGLVFSRNPKGEANRAFFFLVLSAIIWNLFKTLLWLGPEEDLALIWAKLSYIGVFFLSPLWLYFSMMFTGKKFKDIYFLPATLFVLFLPTDYFVKGVVPEWGVYGYSYGSLYFLFELYFILCFGYGLWLLFSAYQQVSGDLKRRVLLILSGSLIGVILALFLNILLPGLGIYFLPDGCIFTTIMLVMIAYSFRG